MLGPKILQVNVVLKLKGWEGKRSKLGICHVCKMYREVEVGICNEDCSILLYKMHRTDRSALLSEIHSIVYNYYSSQCHTYPLLYILIIFPP